MSEQNTLLESNLLEKIKESVAYLHKHAAITPDVAVVLGTGLGDLSNQIRDSLHIPYSTIPHFPVSTVESHEGQFVFGTLEGKKVVAMQGRFHCYEGYSPQQVVYPIQVMRELGAKVLIVSNAAGGLNLDYEKGDLVIIEDHINFMGVNPLIGPNEQLLGPRFPDMSQPYSKELMELAVAKAHDLEMQVHKGVYIGVTGPNLETRAEYRMMREWGADLVGMSTVPEVIAGVHLGMDILGVSVVTDLCDPDHLEPVDIKEVIRTANLAGPQLDKLIRSVIHSVSIKGDS